MILIGYKKCSTCIKAHRWLVENGVDVVFREITVDNPTYDELVDILNKSKENSLKLFNTNGILYKQRNLKELVKTMTTEQQLHYLAQDGMLVKRPILLSDNEAVIGFNEEKYKKMLKL